jgi:hypothetical protein
MEMEKVGMILRMRMPRYLQSTFQANAEKCDSKSNQQDIFPVVPKRSLF